MVRRMLLGVAIGLGIVLSLGAVAGYSTKVYLTDGGDTQVIASGGKVEVKSGGTIELASGGTLTGTVAIGGTGTFATGSGAVSLNGDVTIAAGKDLVFAKGAGYLEMNGTTSGGIKIAPIATGTALATIVNQNVAASTITLPAATCTLPGLGLANVWSSTNEFAGVTQTGASTFATGTGAVSLNGDVTVAAGKDISLAKGTGYIEIVADTSGSLKIIPTAATAQAVTLTTAAQTAGAGTLTIPNLAGATQTIATVAGPDVFADTKLSSKLVKAVAQKAFGSLLMTGIPVDQQLLTIAGRKYEIDANDSGGLEGGGDVNVPMGNVMTADQAVTRIAAAITGDASAAVTAAADTTNDILHLYALTAGGGGNDLTLAENFTNGDVSAATLLDGVEAAVKVNACYRHIITATEATGGAVAALRFDTGLSSICSIQVTYEDAGVNAASDVVIAVTGGIVTLTEGAAPAWDAGDIINLVVIGLQ